MELDVDGYLAMFRNPADEEYTFAYHAGTGLLASERRLGPWLPVARWACDAWTRGAGRAKRSEESVGGRKLKVEACRKVPRR